MTPLTHFEKAVEDAVKGGYKWQGGTVFCIQRGDQFLCTQEGHHSQLVTVHQMLLEVDWWLCLGVGRGIGRHGGFTLRNKFFNHNGLGYDIESFFKGLANEKV
jgi:hypothetical protein